MLKIKEKPQKHPRATMTTGESAAFNFSDDGTVNFYYDDGRRTLGTLLLDDVNVTANKPLWMLEKEAADWANNPLNPNADMLGMFSRAVINPIMNFLSPTLQIGAIARADNWEDYWRKIGHGTNGIVTDNFAQNHPYWSMGANFTGDALISSPRAIIGWGKNIKDYRNLERWTTGVPHNLIGKTGKYMDEEFLNYNGDIWTSSNPDYSRQFAMDLYVTGKRFNLTKDSKPTYLLFDVYAPKTGNYMETPRAFGSGVDGFSWLYLPFKRNPQTGEIYVDKMHKLNRSFKSIGDTSLKLADLRKVKVGSSRAEFDFRPGIKTDNIVQASKYHGYEGTKFYDIMDGGLQTSSGENYDGFINELVLNKGAQGIYKLPFGSSKLNILKQMQWQLPYPYTYSSLNLKQYKSGGRLIPKHLIGNAVELIDQSIQKRLEDFRKFTTNNMHKAMLGGLDIMHKFNKVNFDEFVLVMHPIFRRALENNGIKGSDANRFADYLTLLAANESTYGTSSLALNGYNLGGIKWFPSASSYRGSLKNGRTLEDYLLFDNLYDYANYKINLLNREYQAFIAPDLNSFIDRLHGSNPKGKNYSSSRDLYFKTLNGMKSLHDSLRRYKLKKN